MNTPIIASTVIGLLSVIAYYIFTYKKSKVNSEVENIKALPEKDREKALSKYLNDHGIRIDLKDVEPGERFKLASKTLSNKILKLVITSATAVLIAVIAGAIIITYIINNPDKPNGKEPEPPQKNTFIFSSSFSEIDKQISEKLLSKGYESDDINPYYNIKIEVDSAIQWANQTDVDWDYCFPPASIILNIVNKKKVNLDIEVAATDTVANQYEAKRLFRSNFRSILQDNIGEIVKEIEIHAKKR